MAEFTTAIGSPRLLKYRYSITSTDLQNCNNMSLPKNVLVGKKGIKSHPHGSAQDQSAVQKEAGKGTRNGLFLG